MSSENTPTGFIDLRSGATQMNPRARSSTRLNARHRRRDVHRRLRVAVIGITLALQTFTTALSVTPLWAGLISILDPDRHLPRRIVFGWMTDKYGRKPLFLADLLAFALAAIGTVLRAAGLAHVLLAWSGLAGRADYAIGRHCCRVRATARAGIPHLDPARSPGNVATSCVRVRVPGHPGLSRRVALGARLGLRAGHHLPDRPGTACRESPRCCLSKAAGTRPRRCFSGLGWSLESEDFVAEPRAATLGALFARGQSGDRVRLHLLALPGAPLLRDHLLPGDV